MIHRTAPQASTAIQRFALSCTTDRVTLICALHNDSLKIECLQTHCKDRHCKAEMRFLIQRTDNRQNQSNAVDGNQLQIAFQMTFMNTFDTLFY